MNWTLRATVKPLHFVYVVAGILLMVIGFYEASAWFSNWVSI